MAFKRTVAAATLATAVLAKDVPLEQAKQRLQAVKDKAAKVKIADVWEFNEKFYLLDSDPKQTAFKQAVRFAEKLVKEDPKNAEAKKALKTAEKELKKASNKDAFVSAKSAKGAEAAAKNKSIKAWVESAQTAAEDLVKQTEAAEKLAVSDAAVTKASAAVLHAYMTYADKVDVTSDGGSKAYWAPQQKLKDQMVDFAERKDRYKDMKTALKPESKQVAGLITAMEALADAKKEYKKAMAKGGASEAAQKKVVKEGENVNKKAISFLEKHVLLEDFAMDLSDEQQDTLLGLGDELARIAGTEAASGPKGGSAKVKKENANEVKQIFKDLLEAVAKTGGAYADLYKGDKVKTQAQYETAAAKSIQAAYLKMLQAAMPFKNLVEDVKNLHKSDAPAAPEPEPEAPAAAEAPKKSGVSMGVVAAIVGVVVFAVIIIAFVACAGSSEDRRSRR